jgi:hypothetical protein
MVSAMFLRAGGAGDPDAALAAMAPIQWVARQTSQSERPCAAQLTSSATDQVKGSGSKRSALQKFS